MSTLQNALYQRATEHPDFGGNCDIDVNECASNPCQNGATCAESSTDSSISIDAYRCTCVAGFANGVCEYDFISEYATECDVQESTSSFALGGNCDIDVNECDSSPCQNDAVCSDSNNEDEKCHITLTDAHVQKGLQMVHVRMTSLLRSPTSAV